VKIKAKVILGLSKTGREQMTARLEIDFIRACGINQPRIVVDTKDGQQFVHPHKFRRDDPRLRPFFKKVEAAGTIDPAKWQHTTKRL
jgi:hypothetical protein